MKKRTFQPSLASLTEAELEQLACDLQRNTYAAVLARVRKPRSEGGLGLTQLKSKTPLTRLLDKKNELDLLNALLAARGENRKLTLARYQAMSAGEIAVLRQDPSALKNTPSVAVIHDAILSATYIQVQDTDNSPHQLLALQRLADFPARAQIRENHEQLNREKWAHKLDMDNFRKHIATERLELAKKSFELRQAIAHARLQSLDPYDPSSNQWWGEGAPEPTSTSRTDTTPTTAAAADPESSSQTLSPSPFSLFPPVKNPTAPAFPSTIPNPEFLILNSSFSSLPPAVLANNALYEEKVSIGEIKEISAPGELARVDYSNPADRDFFSTREQSGTARFVPDPTRTQWLPGLRSFGRSRVAQNSTNESDTPLPGANSSIRCGSSLNRTDSPEPPSPSRNSATQICAAPPDPTPFPRPLGGPQFAKRTSLTGEQICGGVGNPLGQGEGGTTRHATAADPSLFPRPLGGEGQGEGVTTPSTHAAISVKSLNIQPTPLLPLENPFLSTQHSALGTHHLNSPSGPSVPLWSNQSCASLSDRVHRYTIARLREHNRWNNDRFTKPFPYASPPFITQNRHCPAATTRPLRKAASPPLHAHSTNFPDSFWSLSPFSNAYIDHLTTRGLPYREPTDYQP